MRAFVASAGLAFSAGCIPIPFAAPPTAITVAPGGAIGKVVPLEEGGSGEIRTSFLVQGRAAMAPLGLVPELNERRFDFRLGYLLEAFPKDELQRYTKHGAFVGGTFYPWISEEWGGGFRGRIGMTPMADILYEPSRQELGGGGSVMAELELVKHGEGSYAGFDGKGAGIMGGAFGEYGIGLNTMISVRGVETERYWFVGGGLTLRFPAVAGIVLIPLWELD